MAMKDLKRGEKILLSVVGDHTYDIDNKKMERLMWADDDYFIYFKNVVFHEDGVIECTYLGQANEVVLDGYCRDVSFDEENGWTMEPNKPLERARYVVVENKKRTIVVLAD